MLLTKLILENYGVYDGRHVLDLMCNENKPVILCGGKKWFLANNYTGSNYAIIIRKNISW